MTAEFRGTPTTNTGKRRRPEVLTPIELDALIEAADARSITGVRARALIGVLYGAGLRVSEALALYPADVDLAECQVFVKSGKGGRSRLVGINPRGCELLGEWLALRPSVGLGDAHPVFATYRAGHAGHPVSPQAARATIKRLGQRAAIRKAGPVHPHLLRHTLAHEMRKAGCDLYEVMRQLGHSSIKTTETYLAGLSARDLAQTLRKVR